MATDFQTKSLLLKFMHCLELFCIPCDVFLYDESKATSVKQFFSDNKHKFPMMAIITEGYYGDTHYDCYDTCQVFRVHGYTTQPRVVCIDSAEAKLQRQRYLSIPVETPVRFRVVKGHQTVGEIQDLETILAENTPPILVKVAVDKKVRVCSSKSGSNWRMASDYGNLLITKHFEERFIQMQCLYTQDLNITPHVNLLALTPEITVAAITGFLPGIGTQEQFQAYLKKLVEISGDEMKKPEYKDSYYAKRGNPDWGICYLDNESLAIGSGDETCVDRPLMPFDEVSPNTGPPPALPPRKGQTSKKGQGQCKGQYQSNESELAIEDDTEGVYEEIPSDYVFDATANPSTQNLYSPKSVKKNFKIDSKKEKKIKEKGLKHLEQSLKCKAEQHGHSSPIIQIKEKVDIKKHTKMKDIAMKPKLKDAASRHTPLPGESKGDLRYVSLARTAQESRYLKVNHQQYDVTEMKNSKAYSDTKLNTIGLSTEVSSSSGHVDDKLTSYTTDGEPKSEKDYARFDVAKMTIKELGESLKALKLQKHVKSFKEQMIDGAIVQELTEEDFMKEFKFTKLEALRLKKFVSTGHIPK